MNINSTGSENRLRKLPFSCFISKNKYGLYCIPNKSSHRPAAKKILKQKVWEPNTIKYILNNSQKDIIHAGTYFGDFLPAISKIDGNAYCFEPNPINYQSAYLTTILNSIDDVSISNCALGNYQGICNLKIKQADKFRGGGSKIVKNSTSNTIKVEINTLDNLFDDMQNIGLIQLDTQGSELEILKGGRNIIKRNKPTLILQTFNKNDKWIKENIISMGYRMAGTCDSNKILKIE